MAETSRLTTHEAAAASDTVQADRRDLALLAVEKTRMPMMVSDARQPDHPIVLANQAFLDLIGYSAEEVLGRNCRFLQGPDTSPAAIQAIRDDIAAERDTQIDLLNYRKDGTPFWNSLHISPLRDEAGTIIYYFASQQNVTRQHEAAELEAAETALLREVDHRAKNALALVQGIVRLSRADDPRDYSTAVQGRVDALAVAHALLADRRWQAVPLDVLIATLVRNMGLLQVTADGPPVGITADQVQPLALILHELLGNAQRHGALSVPAGQLDINWHKELQRVRICLHEVGGPAPATERRPGFGMTVVNAVTHRQLRGEVSFDWLPGGLASEVIIPSDAKVAA